jgi:hypothetical protein
MAGPGARNGDPPFDASPVNQKGPISYFAGPTTDESGRQARPDEVYDSRQGTLVERPATPTP